MSQTITTDVAIIGAGPAGLFAVFECGMLKMRCVLIDSLEATGGQCGALYPEKPIYDVPAYPSILAGELIERLEAHVAVLNRIVTDRNEGLTAQIEGLRDAPVKQIN